MAMKPAEDGYRYNAVPVLDGAMDRGILAERPMSPQLVIVSSILRQNSAQMRLLSLPKTSSDTARLGIVA